MTKKLPVVGIKYCGGCNPRFDRVAFVKKMIKEFEGRVIFKYIQELSEFDMFIVINGCSSACADISSYSLTDNVLSVAKEEDYEVAANRLHELVL